jgi:hypothetical protein
MQGAPKISLSLCPITGNQRIPETDAGIGGPVVDPVLLRQANCLFGGTPCFVII